jgi:hypothetical protein
MRALFLILVLANLLLLAAQLPAVRSLVTNEPDTPRPSQLNADRLRILRDTSSLPAPAAAPATTPTPG